MSEVKLGDVPVSVLNDTDNIIFAEGENIRQYAYGEVKKDILGSETLYDESLSIKEAINKNTTQLSDIMQQPDSMKFNEIYVTKIPSLVVDAQEDFNNMSSYITQKINNNEDVNILIGKGIYVLNSLNQIALSNINNSSIKITISNKPSEKVIITSCNTSFSPSDAIDTIGTHYIVSNSLNYDFGTIFLNEDLEQIKICDSGNLTPIKVNQFVGAISKNNDNTFQCKAPLPIELSSLKNKDSNYFNNSYIFIDSWFTNFVGKNLYTDDTNIYFTVDSSLYSNFDTGVNGDYTFNSLYANFYITNIYDALDSDSILYKDGNLYIPSYIKKLYITKDSQFLKCNNVNLKEFNISGIEFNGFSISNLQINGTTRNNPLIDLNNCYNFNITKNILNNCGNIGINSIGTQINYDSVNSSNISIKYNTFNNMLSSAINIIGDNTEISNNTVKNSCIVFKAGASITLSHGKNYKILSNKIIDCAYNGIGVSDTRSADYNISGIIQYNEIYQTEEFIKYVNRNTLMDGGGIYIFTHQDNCQCVDNIIHDFYGKAYYRGIFADDGAYNTHIHRNLVYNIGGGECISARYVSNIVLSNKNNTFGENVMLGGYTLGANPNYAAVADGRTNETMNIILSNGGTTPSITLQSVYVTEGDSYSSCAIENNKIYANVSPIISRLSGFILSRITNTTKDWIRASEVNADLITMGQNTISQPGTSTDISINAKRNLRLTANNGASGVIFQTNNLATPSIFPFSDKSITLGTGANRYNEIYANVCYTGFGTTSSRPSVSSGAMWFDTTLNKPIWYNGTRWVDATGTAV